MIITGAALALGNDVNTDELHPSRFFSLDDQTVRGGFLGAVEGRTRGADVAGRIVVAGQNFGIGSSRETGARVFLLNQIRAVVAVSFARIFYRNVMNLGLPALVCPGLRGRTVLDQEPVELDLATGIVRIGEERLVAEPLDPYWRAVADAGGLAQFLGLQTAPRKP